jgi:hypothetical protein
MPNPKFQAFVSTPVLSDPAAVRSDVWDVLLEEAVQRLESAGTVAIFGVATTKEILTRWQAEDLRADEARAAFLETEPGTAPVGMISGGTAPLPGWLAALAGVFDYLATLAGPGGRIQFEEEGEAR